MTPAPDLAGKRDDLVKRLREPVRLADKLFEGSAPDGTVLVYDLVRIEAATFIERSAIAPAVKAGWRDIKTDPPPKDREVLLRVKMRAGIPNGHLVGHFMEGGHSIEGHPPIKGGWYFWNGSMFDEASEPTHWKEIDAPADDGAELARVTKERDEALDRVDELERYGESVAAEFEKDCWVAMRSLLNQCQFNWNDGDEVTADDAREFIAETLHDKERGRDAAIARADELSRNFDEAVKERDAAVAAMDEWNRLDSLRGLNPAIRKKMKVYARGLTRAARALSDRVTKPDTP